MIIISVVLGDVLFTPMQIATPIFFHGNVPIEGKYVIDDTIESGGTIKRLIEFLGDNFCLSSLTIAHYWLNLVVLILLLCSTLLMKCKIMTC